MQPVGLHFHLAEEGLLGLLRDGDTVLAARFFRLGRSRDYVVHIINSFCFKSLDLSIDTTIPAGKFMLSIFASLAEYDHQSILEKTKVSWPLPRASTSAGPRGSTRRT